MTLLRTEYEAALEPDGDAPSRATVNSLGSVRNRPAPLQSRPITAPRPRLGPRPPARPSGWPSALARAVRWTTPRGTVLALVRIEGHCLQVLEVDQQLSLEHEAELVLRVVLVPVEVALDDAQPYDRWS